MVEPSQSLNNVWHNAWALLADSGDVKTIVGIVCLISKTINCLSKIPVAMLVHDNFFIINSIVSFIAKVAELTLRFKSAFQLTPLWLGRVIVSQPQLRERIILGCFFVNKVIGTNKNVAGCFL